MISLIHSWKDTVLSLLTPLGSQPGCGLNCDIVGSYSELICCNIIQCLISKIGGGVIPTCPRVHSPRVWLLSREEILSADE